MQKLRKICKSEWKRHVNMNKYRHLSHVLMSSLQHDQLLCQNVLLQREFWEYLWRLFYSFRMTIIIEVTFFFFIISSEMLFTLLWTLFHSSNKKWNIFWALIFSTSFVQLAISGLIQRSVARTNRAVGLDIKSF